MQMGSFIENRLSFEIVLSSVLCLLSVSSLLSLPLLLAFPHPLLGFSFSHIYILLLYLLYYHPLQLSSQLDIIIMDFSMHSRHFDLAQIPMDQDDSKADLLSQPETSHLAISVPTFSHSDWARWRSQPALLTPRQYDGYSFPRVADAEPYNLGPLSQGLMGDSNEYLDSYHSHAPYQMSGTSMEALASQAVVGPSDWGVLDTHSFKDRSYGYPTHLDSLQPLQNSPPSPLSEVSSYHSPQSLAAASPAMTAHTTDRLSPRSITGEHKEERPGHPPYSHLIYQALKDAPGNKLPLQGIYAWFEANTDKGRDPNAKGWQNSIRHNLSMNAVSHLKLTSCFSYL